MPDNTDTDSGDAPADAAQDPTPDSGEGSGAATPPVNQDPVSLLTSRLNGQTAKVGELTNLLKKAQDDATALAARVKAFEEGKVGADEAATARVATLQQELEAERTARRVETLKSRFPETFTVLGDQVAAVMDESALAAAEARLQGTAAPAEPPTPERHGEARGGQQSAGNRTKPQTASDIEARLLSLPLPDGF